MKLESDQLGRATGPTEVGGEQESVMGGEYGKLYDTLYENVTMKALICVIRI